MGLIQGIKNLFGRSRGTGCINQVAEYENKPDFPVTDGSQENSPTETDEVNIKCTFDNSPKPETLPADPDDGIEFLTTKEIKQNIDKIIKDAKSFVTIICAKLELPGDYIEILSNFSKKEGHDVTLICGLENTLEATLSEQNIQLPKSIYFRFVKKLHAKCYMNENVILLPTMNLNKWFDKNENGTDIGLLIYRDRQSELYEKIKGQIDEIKKEVFEQKDQDSRMKAFLNSNNVFYEPYNPDKRIRFLKTQEIMDSIHNIIKNTSKSITIVSPYLDMKYGYEQYIDELTSITNRNIDTNLIFYADLSSYDKIKFRNMEKILYRNKNFLHAKCYINENTALITSMNLTESSQENYEIGIEIDQKHKLYECIKKEIDENIKKSSIKYKIEKTREDVISINFWNQKNFWYCELINSLIDGSFPAYGKGKEPVDGKIVFKPSSVRKYIAKDLNNSIYRNILNQFMAQIIVKRKEMKPYSEDGNFYLVTANELTEWKNKKNIDNDQIFFNEEIGCQTPQFSIFTSKGKYNSRYDEMYSAYDIYNINSIKRIYLSGYEPPHEIIYRDETISDLDSKIKYEILDASDAKSAAEYFAKYFIACYYYYGKFITTPQKAEEIKRQVNKELYTVYEELNLCKEIKDFNNYFPENKEKLRASPYEYYKIVDKWFEKIEEEKNIEFKKIIDEHEKNKKKNEREKGLCLKCKEEQTLKPETTFVPSKDPKIFGEPVFKDMQFNTKNYANVFLKNVYGKKYPDAHIGREGAEGAFSVSAVGKDGKEHDFKSVYFLHSNDKWELRKLTPYVTELLAKTDKNLEISKFSDEKQKNIDKTTPK